MLHCEKCGLRRKPVDEVKIHRSIELRDALPRLVCDKCRTKPPRITASCAWVRKYGPSVGDVDLTWIAQGERRADAA